MLQQRGAALAPAATSKGGSSESLWQANVLKILSVVSRACVPKAWFHMLAGEHSVEIPFDEIRESSHGEER